MENVQVQLLSPLLSWVVGRNNAGSSNLSLSFQFFLILESIEYIRKWNGLCFDGQHANNHKERQRKSEKDCKQKCNSETSCTGYATHSNKWCYFTYNTKFDFSDFSILQGYTCYEKVPGILQLNCFDVSCVHKII